MLFFILGDLADVTRHWEKFHRAEIGSAREFNQLWLEIVQGFAPKIDERFMELFTLELCEPYEPLPQCNLGL